MTLFRSCDIPRRDRGTGGDHGIDDGAVVGEVPVRAADEQDPLPLDATQARRHLEPSVEEPAERRRTSCRNAPRSRDGGNSIDTPTTGQRMREGGCAMTHEPIGDDEMGDGWQSVTPGRGHDEDGSADSESAGPSAEN